MKVPLEIGPAPGLGRGARSRQAELAGAVGVIEAVAVGGNRLSVHRAR